MSNPIIPNKEHDPAKDANRMLNQVASAFSLPWPRKPHGSPPKGAKAAKGAHAPRAARRSVSRKPRRGASPSY